MAAGVFGYMGYDTVRLIERLPQRCRTMRSAFPTAILMRPTVMVDLRRRQGRDHHRHAGPSAMRESSAQKAYKAAVQAPARRVVAALDEPLPHAPAMPAAAAGADARLQHHARRIQGDGGAGQGVHRRRRHLPGGARRSASPRRSRCRRSRSIARCGAPTPRPSCSTSTSAASRSSARARRSWCACATAR